MNALTQISACQVQLLKKPSANLAVEQHANQLPAGCGFVIDSRRIMTCSHVVFACVGRDFKDPDETLNGVEIFGRFPNEGSFRTKRKPHVIKFRVAEWYRHEDALRNATSDINDLLEEEYSDICILEIADQNAHPKIVFPQYVAAANPYQNDNIAGIEYCGRGLSAENPLGFPVEGKIKSVQSNRCDVHESFDRQDLRITEGCSGGALFDSYSGDVIGMVTAAFKSTSGHAIPINTIRKMWHTETGEEAVRVRATKETLLGNYRQKFDRKPPIAEFKDYYQERLEGNFSGLICTIAGTRKDNLATCRKRLFNSAVNKKDVGAISLTEYFSRQVTNEKNFQRIIAEIESKRPKNDEQRIGDLNPTLFSFAISEADLSSPEKLKIVQRLSEYMNQPAANRSEIPIILFLLLEFSSAENETALHVNETFQKYQQFIEEIEGKDSGGSIFGSLLNALGRTPTPTGQVDIRMLPLLDSFAISDVMDFVADQLKSLEYAPMIAQETSKNVRSNLVNIPVIRWDDAQQAIEQNDYG